MTITYILIYQLIRLSAPQKSFERKTEVLFNRNENPHCGRRGDRDGHVQWFGFLFTSTEKKARSSNCSHGRVPIRKTWVPGSDERGRIAIWRVPLLAENLNFGTF